MSEGEIAALRSTVEAQRRSLVVGYIAWGMFGLHYAYFKQYGWQVLFWLTGGGLFIWAIIDLFRIPSIRKEYYHKLTTEAAKDIIVLARA